ncbi:hypothetical protein Hamer_G004973, partial [Homarus americanus]
INILVMEMVGECRPRPAPPRPAMVQAWSGSLHLHRLSPRTAASDNRYYITIDAIILHDLILAFLPAVKYLGGDR